MEQSKSPWRTYNIIPQILEFKNHLQTMRHVVAPMQDVVARISRGDIALFSEDEMIYYRNIGTHVKRVLARIDGLNELVTTALSLNVSIAASRHAEISKQLTVIATIFLPLTFITGFFGQNFGWLVNNIGTGPEFAWLGMGTELLALAILFAFFIRRHWL
jgi:magnesium transporter